MTPLAGHNIPSEGFKPRVLASIAAAIVTRRGAGALPAAVALMLVSGPARAADVSVHASGRYYQDANGQPVFLIGYYDWASPVDGYFIDHPSRYAEMMTRGSPYRINYIRISIQGNRMTASTQPPSWNGQPTPVPIRYVNGKADLNQWDPVFWTGVRNQCALARELGIIVHLAFVDGVGLRSGPSWGYSNSWWNPANQTMPFYSNPDANGNGGIDENGEFYQTAAFNNATGIGFYQKRHIDKAIAETADFDNVMFEVGNELAADSAWNSAVIAYIKSKTNKVVTQGGNDTMAGHIGAGVQGWSQHLAKTVAQFKSSVANIVGNGYPAWEDPDNNEWSCSFGYCTCGGNCAAAWAAQDTGCRQAAWYSFVGGAAAFGGFNIDFWDWWNPQARGFSDTLGDYCKNLQNFISDSRVRFWNMRPMHNLVSNAGTNSCLSDVGLVPPSEVEYVVYVLSDASITVDLSGVSGSRHYRLYDPIAGIWSEQQTTSGGAARTFTKPAGASDWVIYIGDGGPAETCPTPPSAPGDLNPLTLGSGIMPAVAVDAQGGVHVIYLSGNSIQYRKYDPALNLIISEAIATPNGAYYPHTMCDASGAPHITFTNASSDYASTCYYSNRMGGSWKSPVAVFQTGAGDSLWYPRIGLWSTFAYIGFQYGLNPALVGEIVRITNLATAPVVDVSVTTTMRSGIAINGSGHVFAIGRNGPAGTYCQEYDSNLNPVGGFHNVMAGYPGGSQAAWADTNNAVHFVTWSIQSDGPGPCNDRCGMNYNNTGRQNPDGSFQFPIQGLLGGLYGSGPDGFDPSNSGFWNDDVQPVIVVDATQTVYVAWRGWTAAGEGRITTVNNTGFTQTCTPEATCGTSICTGREFTPSITRRRWWNCEMAPGRNGGVYVVWDSGGTAYLRGIDVPSAAEAAIDLGAPDAPNGITHPQNDDGNTKPATTGARECRRNVNPIIDRYMYFAVSDAWAFQASRPDVYITIDYYDEGTGSLTLQFDSIGPADIPHEYAAGGSVTLTGTNTWKALTFHLTNAWFGNRQNAGADFRIGGNGNLFYLDKVRVTTEPPVAPIIAPVTPNPQMITPGIPYALTPTLSQGYPPPTWTLVEGPAGAIAAPACGRISGWTPPVGSTGCVTFTLQAANSAGSNTESWMVCILSRMDFDQDNDVDLGDFARMQACFSGSGLACGPDCSKTDTDTDGDVDADDFIGFLPCLAGANRTPGC